jgi:tRNA(adenine34) deaminase
MFSDDDKHFMSLALGEAEAALAAGDYPVGAALVVNGNLWATARNSLFSDAQTTAHAEHNLLSSQSKQLRAAFLHDRETKITLYTTLEPCLMCLGTAVLHRVSTIVIACPDPNGGTTNVDTSTLDSVYRRWWPAISMGLYRERSASLIIEFLKSEKFFSWQSMLDQFQTMQQQWQEATRPSWE